MLTIHIYLAPRLRMSGAIPQLPVDDFITWTGKHDIFSLRQLILETVGLQQITPKEIPSTSLIQSDKLPKPLRKNTQINQIFCGTNQLAAKTHANYAKRVGQCYRLVRENVYAGLKGIKWHEIIYEFKRYGLIEWTTQTNTTWIPCMP
jgi:hypothetical protein